MVQLITECLWFGLLIGVLPAGATTVTSSGGTSKNKKPSRLEIYRGADAGDPGLLMAGNSTLSLLPMDDSWNAFGRRRVARGAWKSGAVRRLGNTSTTREHYCNPARVERIVVGKLCECHILKGTLLVMYNPI